MALARQVTIGAVAIIAVLLLRIQMQMMTTTEVKDRVKTEPNICSYGPGIWCSEVDVNCSQSKQCKDLPESVHPQVKPNDVTWWKAMKRLRKHAKKFAAAHPKPTFLFLGDSITETLRGTMIGNRCKENFCKGFPDAFPKHFGDNSVALGIGGDRTEHVLYRIVNGELDGMEPKTIIVLIGTNNVKWGHSVENVTEGVISVVRILCAKFPKAKILTMAILPRGDCKGEPTTCVKHRIPNRKNTAVLAVNSQIALQLPRVCPNGIYLDCSEVFINSAGDGIASHLMGDSLHPGLEGFEKMWANCLIPHLKEKQLWDS